MNWIHWIPVIISITCAVISTGLMILNLKDLEEIRRLTWTHHPHAHGSAGTSHPSRSEIHVFHDCTTCGSPAINQYNNGKKV